MKIFITGAAGFIGHHVVELLAAKHHDLMLLVRNKTKYLEDYGRKKQIKFIIGDLLNIEKLKESICKFKPDAVLHLAWEGLPDYSVQICSQNLKYTVDLFTIAAESGCEAIISTGSCWEYKKKAGSVKENSACETTKIFSAVKNSLCLMGEAISKEYGIKFYWPRIFFVYGPGQRKTSLIPYIIESLKNNRIPEINNPDNKNDFVYVKDVAKALVSIIEKKPDKIIYNVGSGYSTSVSKIISILQEIAGFDNMSLNHSKGIGDDFWADISSIQKDLKWSPEYSIKKGIKETVNYYLQDYGD